MEKDKEKKVKEVFERVLKDVKPSNSEIESNIANINRLTSRLKKIVPGDVEIRVTGSVARGTNLAGDTDIDIFLLFDKRLERDKVIRLGVEYGKRLARRVNGERYEIKYAEHPYIRLFLDSIGIRADIVPAFKIDRIEEMGTSVDRTPLHTDFINSKLSEEQRDHVRLLKYLLKMHGIYGAEIKTKGFSGYLCELLIYQFGSLQNLLQNAVKFRLPIVIVPGGKVVDSNKLVEKFKSDFVVIDPIDPDRNVAAVVSKETLGKFVLIANQFIKRPNIESFYGKGFSSTDVERLLKKFIDESGLDLYLIVSRVPDKSEDIIWPQLKKAADIINDYICKFGFQIYLTAQWVQKEKGFILIVAQKMNMDSILLKGPSALMSNASAEFLGKHKNAFGIIMKEDRIYALEKNRYINIEQVINAILSGKLIKKRKDINLKAGKLFLNKIPKDYAEATYVELRKKMTL